MANHMPDEPHIVEGIGNILLQMKEFGRPQLLVRVYPKDRTKSIRRTEADTYRYCVPGSALGGELAYAAL